MIIAIVLLVIIFHMSVMWIWYRLTNNPSVVDVGWAIGLTLCGVIYLCAQGLSFRTLILGMALVIWGIRLGGYLWWTRIRHHKIDKRYEALGNSWTIQKPLGFFINFQLQGIFIFLVSISWYFTSLNPATYLSIQDIAGLLLFIIALCLESLADLQLQRFKKTFPGQVCNQKLWRLSRHPNYFFEWLIWCSFSIFALASPFGMLSLISPLTLYLIMRYLTIPITERQSLLSRGEAYANYQFITPAFFPRIRNFFK